VKDAKYMFNCIITHIGMIV